MSTKTKKQQNNSQCRKIPTGCILAIVEAELQLAASRAIASLPSVNAEAFAKHAQAAFARAKSWADFLCEKDSNGAKPSSGGAK